MKENARSLAGQGPALGLDRETSQRIVDVVRVEDVALLLEVEKQGEGKACIGR